MVAPCSQKSILLTQTAAFAVECEIVVFTEAVQRCENGQRKADTDALDPVVQRSAIARFFFRQCTEAIVQRWHIGKCRADVSYSENADDGR